MLLLLVRRQLLLSYDKKEKDDDDDDDDDEMVRKIDEAARLKWRGSRWRGCCCYWCSFSLCCVCGFEV
jgi:hypothetical protein